MKKRYYCLLAALLLAGLVTLWFFAGHVIVCGRVYPATAEVLDFRGENFTETDYRRLRERMPGCRILWDVPFQGDRVPSDTTEFYLERLTDSDVERLIACFLELRTVHAEACTDYAQLAALEAAFPQAQVLFSVRLDGREFARDTASLTLEATDGSELTDRLPYFPALKEVHLICPDMTPEALLALGKAYPNITFTWEVEAFGGRWRDDVTALNGAAIAPDSEPETLLRYFPKLKAVDFAEPAIEAERLLALTEARPDITFTWTKTVLGTAWPQDVTELYFTGIPVEDAAALEGELAYFPQLQKVELMDSGLDNETLAAWRERARDRYKLVWQVMIGYLPVRTDATTFMPAREHQIVHDLNIGDIRYCEDMLVVDIGHTNVSKTDWIYGMPHLQFLVLADTKVSDLTPVGTLKELIYLEIFKCPRIRDYSPLVGCTALQDVNMAFTYGDGRVLGEMTWVRNMWVNCCNLSPETKQYLQESLPDTVLELESGWHLGGGWRDLENYYKMRDLLEMPYYSWGATTPGNTEE